MVVGSKNGIYRFDNFKLNTADLMLYRDEAEVSLPPKVVKTLAILVENSGQIISKNDLINHVWTDAVVEEANLTQHLYLLRKTLGNMPEGKQYIETLRRRGYRFNGQVKTVPESHAGNDPWAGASGSATTPHIERDGNVLRVVDWLPVVSQVPEMATLPETAAIIRPRRRIFPRAALLLAAALLIVLAASGAGVFIYNRMEATNVQASPEIAISRLTNGLGPRGATISPDGKYFVYHESGPEYKMWLQQTGHSSRVEIIPASERALCCTVFSPDAEFIYYLARDLSGNTNSLYRVPKLGGPAAKIRPNVTSAVSFSPDGREIVYSRFDKLKSETEYVIAASDGLGDERIVHRLAGPYSTGPAWSPDGETIAFAHSLSGEAGDYVLTTLRVADGSVMAVSDESWDACHRLAWRADGRGFYFIGTKKGERLTPRRDQLYFVSYPGGRSRMITNDPTARQQPDSLGVANDGSVLTVPYNRASQIWAMDANGDSRTAVQLTSGSSDGRAGVAPLVDGRVAFIAPSGDNANIFVMDQDGSGQKALLADPIIPDEPRSSRGTPYLVFSIYDWPYSHLFRANPDGSEVTQLTFGESREIDSSISNDGKWVAYGRLAVPVKETDISLWKVPISGGEPIRLKQDNCLMPHFSPDDKLLSCVEDGKTIQILSAADGTLVKSIAVTPLASLNSGARWTPDGRSVAYIVTQKGVSNIWLHPIDGGAPRPLTDFNIGSIYNFVYSADGSRLFLARGQQIRDAILIRDIR